LADTIQLVPSGISGLIFLLPSDTCKWLLRHSFILHNFCMKFAQLMYDMDFGFELPVNLVIHIFIYIISYQASAGGVFSVMGC